MLCFDIHNKLLFQASELFSETMENVFSIDMKPNFVSFSNFYRGVEGLSSFIYSHGCVYLI